MEQEEHHARNYEHPHPTGCSKTWRSYASSSEAFQVELPSGLKGLAVSKTKDKLPKMLWTSIVWGVIIWEDLYHTSGFNWSSRWGEEVWKSLALETVQLQEKLQILPCSSFDFQCQPTEAIKRRICKKSKEIPWSIRYFNLHFWNTFKPFY